MTGPRAILFDFGGTLDLASHWLDRFLGCYRAAGLELHREEFDKAFTDATRLGYAQPGSLNSLGLAGLTEFLVGKQFEYLQAAGPDAVRESLEQMGREGRARLAGLIVGDFVEQTFAGLKRSRRILEELKPRFKLGVVSNFYGNLEIVLAEARMEKLIDVALDSTRVGIFKPDPRIFELALARLQVAAREAAMVGDSLAKDCVPAHRLGMRTILIDAGNRGPKDVETPGVPDRKIGSLDELLAIRW